jgi:PIN domain nuclease of toxin-antitoxin system
MHRKVPGILDGFSIPLYGVIRTCRAKNSSRQIGGANFAFPSIQNTHAWAWSLRGDPRLPEAIRARIAQASTVLVSPISFYEIAQKVRLGTWPQMAPLVESLPKYLADQGGKCARLEPEICLRAAALEWTHRDPFDRLLAATALHFKIPIVSADSVFDGIVARVW